MQIQIIVLTDNWQINDLLSYSGVYLSKCSGL